MKHSRNVNQNEKIVTQSLKQISAEKATYSMLHCMQKYVLFELSWLNRGIRYMQCERITQVIQCHNPAWQNLKSVHNNASIGRSYSY